MQKFLITPAEHDEAVRDPEAMSDVFDGIFAQRFYIEALQIDFEPIYVSVKECASRECYNTSELYGCYMTYIDNGVESKRWTEGRRDQLTPVAHYRCNTNAEFRELLHQLMEFALSEYI